MFECFRIDRGELNRQRIEKAQVDSRCDRGFTYRFRGGFRFVLDAFENRLIIELKSGGDLRWFFLPRRRFAPMTQSDS